MALEFTRAVYTEEADLARQGVPVVAGTFVRVALLEASRNEWPMPRLEADAHFDESASWGSPAARIEAAEGIVVLASHSTCANADILEAVDRLAADPVPAVRFQVVR